MGGKLGERAIINLLTGIYGQRRGLPLEFDDDVAAIPRKDGTCVILKCDMLVGRTDVPPGMSLWQAARKAVIATVSDFAAKGVKPRALLVSLGLPESFGRGEIRQVGVGLERGAREYQCPIVGGDTNLSDDLVIDCTGMGEADIKMVMRRDGARPGDIVAVTGLFGNSAAGLRLAMSNKKSQRQRTLTQAVNMPRARLREGLALARTGLVTASIDSSDGLAWSLHQLARSSKVGIHLDTVPLAAEARRFADQENASGTDLALYGGEEYELVLTMRKDGLDHVKRKVPGLILIGRVVKNAGTVTAYVEGKIAGVDARGYEHFRESGSK